MGRPDSDFEAFADDADQPRPRGQEEPDEEEDEESDQDETVESRMVEGLIWIDDASSTTYLLNGNEAFNDQLNVRGDNDMDAHGFSDRGITRRKNGLWFLMGNLLYENGPDDYPTWDVWLQRPTQQQITQYGFIEV